MRAKGAIIQQFLLATALLVGVCWNLAHAGELRAIRVDSGATGTRAELRLDREVPYDLISLSSPERLVVDLPGVVLDKGLQLPAGSGLVQGVRSGHPVPGTTRIVFDLADPRWKGQVAIADPRFGSTSFHVAALYAELGDQRMDDYFRRLKRGEIARPPRKANAPR